MIGRVLCWLVLVALTVLPIILRSRGLRILSVVALLFVAHSLLWSGLHRTARNADIPDRETLTSRVVYADAWKAGLQATQSSKLGFMALIKDIRNKILRRKYEFSKHAVDQTIVRDIT